VHTRCRPRLLLYIGSVRNAALFSQRVCSSAATGVLHAGGCNCNTLREDHYTSAVGLYVCVHLLVLWLTSAFCPICPAADELLHGDAARASTKRPASITSMQIRQHDEKNALRPEFHSFSGVSAFFGVISRCMRNGSTFRIACAHDLRSN
jgi:hypothetical protein